MKNERVLVTGGAGLIGSYLAEELVGKNEVVILKGEYICSMFSNAYNLPIVPYGYNMAVSFADKEFKIIGKQLINKTVELRGGWKV